MPHKDADARKAYYREWKKRGGKKVSNKYYDAKVHANRRAALYGVPGVLSVADVRGVLSDAVCFYCGGDGSEYKQPLGLDHRVALAEGGANVPANLVACCHGCNASKMRGDRPRRWAWKHDACVECGTTAKPHVSRGLCRTCYSRDYERSHPGRRSKNHA